MEEEILRLEVAMHDVVLIENPEGIDDLGEVDEGCTFGETTLLFEKFLKGTAVAELIDKVEVIDCFEHIEVLDDVLAGFEVCEDVDFVVGTLLKLWILFELLGLNHLDRDLLLVLHVDRLVDCRVHPPPDLHLQRIVFDQLPHLK
jgi:hypothetical protein